MLVVLALMDAAVGWVLLAPLFVLAPVLLALRAGPVPAGLAGLAAFALALASGLWNNAFDTAGWAVGVLVVGAGSVAAVLAAAARERFRRDARRLEILVALGDAADAGSSTAATAGRLCGLLVPAVADVCVIQLAAAGAADRVAAARLAPPHDAGVEDHVRRVRCLDGIDGDPDAPCLLDPVTDAALALAAPDDAALEALRSLALRSSVCAPLRVGGRVVGQLWMAVGRSGRRFGARDVQFAAVVADRVAIALENAGLSAELLDAQRRFEAIVDGMLDGVTVRGADGALVYANDAAIEMLRVGSRDELQRMARGEAMALFDVFAEDGRRVTLGELPGARAWHMTEDPAPMVVRNVVRATGEQRWLLSKAIAIRHADGRPEYVVNFTEDVTAVKRAEFSQRVLAEAGRVLVSSLDISSTLQQVATLAVPELADWCGVDMPARGAIASVAVSHVDPEMVRVARRLRETYAVGADEPHGMAAVIRGDVPHFLVDETPDEALAGYAVDEEHLALLRAVGFNSIMIVPVVGHSGIIGALTFVSALPRRFDDQDLELVKELGRRAGVAVENSRLYNERADIAHTLQIALVPDPVPLAPGWDVAALYRPAGEAAEAGGDFYDMVRTDDGWLVVMGDVAGKGAGAASLTALARYTLRTAAMLTGDPEAALAALNVGLMRRSDAAYCTAVLVSLVESGDGARARVLSAGHPLPVLMQRGMATPFGTPGPLLGAIEGAGWPTEEVALAAGDRLVLYTDGVTDARGPKGRFGDERLLRLLASMDGAPPADVVGAVERALRGYQVGPQRDDTAVLAVARLRPGELALPGGPESVGLARAAIAARLQDQL
ncbi:MAG: hypothetical protein QOH46_2679, partial [Solirubrobacteraceae bacterium]|nr:hypothetical protein [Solirubrobacteraceae bacterium]